ncbi:MAG: sugar ABC transporter permease [bacterium]|nr:sugar ABC transporter permease [bacterium]
MSTETVRSPAAVGVVTEHETGGSGETALQPARRNRLATFLFVVPAFLAQLIWGWYPLVMAFLLAFTDGRVRGAVSFTGIDSYRRILADPNVGRAFGVTIQYAALSIVLTFIIPIFVAILLMEMPRRHMRWMMLLWFLPLSPIAGAVLWRYMYNAQYGLLQSIVTGLGLPSQPFLNSEAQVLFWLIFPGILFFGPGLIYMAALQSIPQSYYEAAEVEGASFWRKIWTITLPRLRPITVLMLMFAIIGSLQQFEWPLLMTGGGPNGASRTVVMYLYTGLLPQLRYSDATALAVILFGVIMTITILFRTFVKEDPDV